MSISDLSPIEQRVKKNIKAAFPHNESPSMVIGVSGGIDSMCLLHILHILGVDLQIVHVNYQKRGADAEADAKLVEQIASKMDIDCKIITVEPEEAAGKNFQQWARELRYSSFEIKAEAEGADAIAVAHHRDDQIETILQKIFRGGGLVSWSGMQVWDGRLFRPLLGTGRREIENYCKVNDIPFRTDETNLTSNYARNFLRNEWLAELEKHFPGWQKNVLRIREQAAVFESAMDYILADISDERHRLHRTKFLQLDESLQKSVLLRYIQRIDNSQEISRRALSELEKLDDLQTGKSVQLTRQIELMRDRTHFKVLIDTGDSGSSLIIERDQLKEHPVVFNGLKFQVQPLDEPNFKQSLYLDADSVTWPLRLRRWKAGDRFQPLGMEGHQTVADHLANRKISAAEKEKALVLESFEETICAVIFPPIENRVPPGTISEAVKCRSSTRQCITINRIL